MMAQYLEIKAAHPDSLLFYRMGDFYELFFEDAEQASAALDIALTKRGQHLGRDIPMCGVPVHSHEAYLSRLIRQGFKVAVCEQLEDPAEAKRRGGKAVVKRDVIRVITPGTLTEEALLDARVHNYLAALAEAGGDLALAWVEVSTGDFAVEPLGEAGLAAALARLDPGEILVSDRLLERPEVKPALTERRKALTPLPAARFDSENARARLARFYGLATLDALGAFGRAEVAAAGALLDYLELTQKGQLPHLLRLRRQDGGSVMEIDAATRRNLELTQSLAGGRAGSLLEAIDRTVTGAGARLLAARLAAPLTAIAPINDRLDGVAFFLADERLRAALRKALRTAPDVERALARLTLGRGGPRDLAAVCDGLRLGRELLRLVAGTGVAPPPEIDQSLAALDGNQNLVEQLEAALAAELPLLARDGGFVAGGHSAALDEQRSLRDESKRVIAGLQARYVTQTGIASLKIRHNNVLGYFIEATATQAEKMPSGAASPFIHRQTLASAVRYTTVELSNLEQKIARAAQRALAIELEIFDALVAAVAGRATAVAEAARALACLDLSTALAELAAREGWCRPSLVAGTAFRIVGGRHPVVEPALRREQAGAFVANDCALDEAARIWLLTGPNMAGKSTFLRQNALIALLAQMGSYVPATAAEIGIVDRLFSRVGAADDLARGRSTFMVEMVETAAILNQAGPCAFVILDEIGRGTATFDGLSIAWATLEHLHEKNRCRTLFATHYHELTALAARLSALSCHAMRVKEWQGEVVFLHEVVAGAADRSYGIHVARLAGLPATAVARAEEVLALLEQSEQAGALARLADDLPLFIAAAKSRAQEAPAKSALERRLAEINPDALTPREALELLYELRRLLNEAKES